MDKVPAVAPPLMEMFWDATKLCQVEGFWYYPERLEEMAAFRTQFEPRNGDVLLTSFPKTGTTWLIALCHTILNIHEEDDILTKKGPHEVVPPLDLTFLADQVQDLLSLNNSGPGPAASPRSGLLLHTHLPYSCLPESVKGPGGGGCKLVHVARNPKDTVVSMWHYYNKCFKSGPEDEPFPLEGAVESFCTGVLPFGPFYEHVVGYWEESRRRPEEVLFLKYEELCREPHEQVRKLASFLGKPFREDAEVEKVLWRSSFNRLKEMEVNKNGVGELIAMPNATFFRKGIVGDWKNCLTVEMAQRIDHLTRLKLQGTGLSLDDF